MNHSSLRTKQGLLVSLVLLILLGGLLTDAFAAKGKKEKKEEKKKEQEIQENTEAALPAMAPVVARTPVQPVRITSLPVRVAPPVVRPVDTSAIEAAKIQRDLDDIVRIHESLKVQQQQEVLEIQRIIEQARIHRTLLKTIGPTARTAAATPEEALKVQKIKLIEEEARQNRAKLEQIQESSKKGKEAEKPAPQKPAEKKKSFWWWTSEK